MDAKLAACLGYSVRLATRCGYMELLPHLQQALFALVSCDAHVDSAAVPQESRRRRTISLFQALHPDGSDVPNAQYAQEVKLVDAPQRLLADAEAQTCEDIISAGECTMIVDKIMDQAKASAVALEERLRQLEADTSDHFLPTASSIDSPGTAACSSVPHGLTMACDVHRPQASRCPGVRARIPDHDLASLKAQHIELRRAMKAQRRLERQAREQQGLPSHSLNL
ncbi:unnamed protein product [Symbiodinium natans]|uniref:Uncharacterized protein n=1 Tax=Symbiodinium natans TaxID=878477 RepID=A0A812UK40_9DINO|nr:unnamed protein product [Symbiodinium natans]